MTEDPIRKELDALKKDLAQLRTDIAGLTDAVKTVAGERVGNTRDQARERVQGAREEIERKLDELLAQGREAVDGVEQQIAQHPGSSILTAFGLGFIIARLLDLGGRR